MLRLIPSSTVVPSFRWIAPAFALLLVNCGSGSSGTSSPATPDFGIVVAPPANIQAGASGSATLTVTRTGGHSAALTLGLSSPPTGITGSGTIGASASSGTLTLNVAIPTAPSTYTLAASASDGTYTHSAPLSLTVNPIPSVTAWGAISPGAAQPALIARRCSTSAWSQARYSTSV